MIINKIKNEWIRNSSIFTKNMKGYTWRRSLCFHHLFAVLREETLSSGIFNDIGIFCFISRDKTTNESKWILQWPNLQKKNLKEYSWRSSKFHHFIFFLFLLGEKKRKSQNESCNDPNDLFTRVTLPKVNFTAF